MEKPSEEILTWESAPTLFCSVADNLEFFGDLQKLLEKHGIKICSGKEKVKFIIIKAIPISEPTTKIKGFQT
jgi:hypothetical protein